MKPCTREHSLQQGTIRSRNVQFMSAVHWYLEENVECESGWRRRMKFRPQLADCTHHEIVHVAIIVGDYSPGLHEVIHRYSKINHCFRLETLQQTCSSENNNSL